MRAGSSWVSLSGISVCKWHALDLDTSRWMHLEIVARDALGERPATAGFTPTAVAWRLASLNGMD